MKFHLFDLLGRQKMNKGYDQYFKQVKKNSNTSSQKPLQRPSTFKNKSNHPKPTKEKRTFPIIQFIVFLFCGCGLFLAIENYDQLEAALDKVEISLGTAYAADSVKTEQPLATTPMLAVSETVKPVAATIDENDYLFQLNERKKVLDVREEELNKKSTEIDKQKLELEQKLKELEESRQKISTLLQDRIKADSSKVDTLVQVYSNMKPQQAAKIFETMDEDLVIEILSRMKKKNAADILNLVKTDKAQVLAEKYTGYRLPSSATSQNNPNNESDSQNLETPSANPSSESNESKQ